MADAVRQRSRVERARIFETVQRFTHSTVTDRMHVHDPAALFGRHHQLAETGRVEQQLPLLVAVVVRLDHRGALPWKLQYPVGKYLDSRKRQVGYAIELLLDLVEHLQVGRLALRVHEQQRRHMHVQLTVFRQLAVQRQDAEVVLGGAHLEE
ncbi:hypothetical protein FQZ97_834710 [compost metagenome]